MDNRLFFPATQRNKICIGDVLSEIHLKKGFVLEIGSGSGEHGVEFQKRFPDLIWQTSDPELKHRKSIISWIDHEKLDIKMPKPLEIDVTKSPWPIPLKLIDTLEVIISINMIHIAPWECTKSLFKESGTLLNYGKFLILYGPSFHPTCSIVLSKIIRLIIRVPCPACSMSFLMDCKGSRTDVHAGQHTSPSHLY